MEKLPMDIVHHILEYNGTVKYRNGVYINRIPRDDKRYDMLRNLASKTFECQLLDNGEKIYKTRVELKNFTLLFIQNHPFWYHKNYIVYKCRFSRIYTKIYCIK